MRVDPSQLFFSPTILLWLIVTAIAAAILFRGIQRRRLQLTRSLRDHVQRCQNGRETIPAANDEPSDH